MVKGTRRMGIPKKTEDPSIDPEKLRKSAAHKVGSKELLEGNEPPIGASPASLEGQQPLRSCPPGRRLEMTPGRRTGGGR
jgi:hypothetical protein